MCALGGREGERAALSETRRAVPGRQKGRRDPVHSVVTPGSVPNLCRGLAANTASCSILPHSLGVCCHAGQHHCRQCAALPLTVLLTQSCEWPEAFEIRVFLQLYLISGL